MEHNNPNRPIGRSMPIISSNVKMFTQETEVEAEESNNDNWDTEIVHSEENNEVQMEQCKVEVMNEIEQVCDVPEDVEMEDLVEEAQLESTYDNAEEVTTIEQAVDNTALHQEDFLFYDDSDDDSEDDIEPSGQSKDLNVLVNILGRKMSENDLKYAADMKIKMKEFFKKYSPDMSFSTLVHLFIEKVPRPKPIFVLAFDEQPKDLLQFHKYAIMCAVRNCENAYFREGGNWESIEQKKNFFGFPPDPAKCKEWILKLNKLRYINKSVNEMQFYRVCEDHFAPEDFTNKYREELLETAVPTLQLGVADNADIGEI